MYFQCEGLNPTSFAGWRKRQGVTSAPAQGLEDGQVTADFHRNLWQTEFPAAQPPEGGHQGDIPGGVERVNLDKDSKHQLAPRLPAKTRVPEWQDGVQPSPCRPAGSDTCQDLGELGSPCAERGSRAGPCRGECHRSVCHWLSPAPAPDAVGWKLRVQFYLLYPVFI